MRIRLIIILFVIIRVPALWASANLEVKNGILDLRNTDITTRFIVRLNGQWEFYWNKLLQPADFSSEKPPVPDEFITVPSYWTESEIDGVELKGQGYATYRLRILLPQGLALPLGLDLKVFNSTYNLYVNGNFLGSSGKTGTSKEDSEPDYYPTICRFIPKTDTIDIIINVSNFHHRRGGFWQPVAFGTFSQVQSAAARHYGWAISNLSIFAAFALFFMFLSVIYFRDKLPLYFSIALIGIALKQLVTNEYLIHLFYALRWDWIIRFEYFSNYLMLAGGFLFLVALFNSKYHFIVARVTIIMLSLMFLGTLVLPVDKFEYFSFPVYGLSALFAINSLTCSLIQFKWTRQITHIIYFAGFLIIALAAIHDEIVNHINITGSANYIVSESILIFILIQSGLIMYRWVKSFREEERLRGTLELMNRDLESIVEERTEELVKARNIAEAYSNKIELQNKSLTGTIQLKNKVFAVIAHDLRSPVVNIQYILNLLKEEEFRNRHAALVSSAIQYSQIVIDLLENMLLWGREQTDRIRYSPDNHNIADIILTNMSIYKDSADRKNISVNFTQKGNTVAWSDKDLVDIIIRNLLSNAIKYTYRGGRISILLKEEPGDKKSIVMKICDNGTGITADKQATLFTSECIDSTPGTENEKGSGFGLKLVYELVMINKGTISSESKPGEGSCFTIALPAQKTTARLNN